MYRQISIILLLAVFLAGPAGASISGPQNNWEPLYVAGKKELDNRRYKQAETSLLQALQAASGDSDKQFITFDALEELYEEQKNYAASEKMLLASLALMRLVPGYPESIVGSTYQKISEAEYFLGHHKVAEQYAQAAMPIVNKNCGPQSPEAAVALNNLGWVESGTQKLKQAETHFLQSLAIISRTLGEKTVLYGMVANNLANVYTQSGNHQAALLWFRRSSAALDDALGSDDSFAQEVAVQCRDLQTTPRHRKFEKVKNHK